MGETKPSEHLKPTLITDQQDMFAVIGSFGTWQKRIFAVFFCVNIIGIWQNFAITFLAPNMEYWCVSPTVTELMNGTVWNPQWNSSASSSAAAPIVTIHKCYFDVTRNFSDGGPESRDAVRVPCTKWEYDLTYYSHTIVSEWDLVCDREWMISLSKSVYMVGFLFSVFILGQTSDYGGRFPTILISYAITTVAGTLSAFSTSFPMFIVLRFFQAFGRTGLTTIGFVLLLEIVGPEWRTSLGIAIQVGWCVGFVTLPAVAWLFKHWSYMQIAMVVPFLPLICIYWIVPESPRWLMTQRKREKFEEVIAKAARINGRELKEDLSKILPFPPINKMDDKAQGKTFLDLVRTPLMRKRVIYMACLWSVNAFVYYSLAYNTNDLGGDPYLNFFLSGLQEFFSYAAVFPSINKLGRKTPLLGGMMVGGAACALIMAVPPEIHWLSTSFSMIGKFCITGTFGILYLYTMEMFPTVVRSVAIGSCSTFARIGSIVAPFARELGMATHYTVPNALNAGLTVSSALLVLLLPETKDKRIPDTLEEGEAFGIISASKESQESLPITQGKTETAK